MNLERRQPTRVVGVTGNMMEFDCSLAMPRFPSAKVSKNEYRGSRSCPMVDGGEEGREAKGGNSFGRYFAVKHSAGGVAHSVTRRRLRPVAIGGPAMLRNRVHRKLRWPVRTCEPP